MTEVDQRTDSAAQRISFLAAASALHTISEAVHTVDENPATAPDIDPEQALAALLLLREVRHRLADWETPLIETAREAGASWAELAVPLGVASRQAAERRYLRLRPTGQATGEQRVRAARDQRAAERAVTVWARRHAADLRQLAGQISALDDLPGGAATAIAHLTRALAAADAARLLSPLTATRPHLEARHPDLAARVDTLVKRTKQLRQESGERRAAPPHRPSAWAGAPDSS
ncbi:type III effector protein [Kitasatospora sp. MAP5-34]|uniref:type III effector protein n=1 Tax=Kitasatospora sp. MAP5-34 TaxID=3035102 RepID=UPI0024765404|nr:type III effector protein [Kitasatospora sp. MAP5-34]MDH6580497.1 hypothetical protein [Kitasatospora sp. MAP5-34]